MRSKLLIPGLVAVALALATLIATPPAFAACCACSCSAPGDVCADVPENECSDFCGNQSPSCGFDHYSAGEFCTQNGCAAGSNVPVAASTSLPVLAVAMVAIGTWSLWRRTTVRKQRSLA